MPEVAVEGAPPAGAADPPSSSTLSLWVRLPVAAALLAIFVVGQAFIAPKSGDPSAIGLEMASDAKTFGQVLNGAGPNLWGDTSKADRDARACKTDDTSAVCVEAVHQARDALNRDWLYIAAYSLTGCAFCALGGWRSRRGGRQMLLYAAACAAIVAGIADGIENKMLYEALSEHAGNAAKAATIAATVKFALVPMFMAGALLGLWVFVRTRVVPAPRSHFDLSRVARWQPPESNAWEFGRNGVCLSGGGIRSAAFCLGVLQRLEEGDADRGSALGKTRYLAAVSGGGYTAGAAQLHASLSPGASPPFAAGSPEADHLRRHGNYLADSAGEWFAAISQALAKMLANLALCALVLVALAPPLGWLGRLFLGAQTSAVEPGESWPEFRLGLGLAIAALAVPALLLAASQRRYMTSSAASWLRTRRNGLSRSLAIAFGFGAVLVTVTAVVLPLLNTLGMRAAALVGHPEGVTAMSWPTVLLAGVLGRVVTKAMKKETSGGSAAADPTTKGGARGSMRLPFAKNIAELAAGPLLVVVALGYVTALAQQARSHGPFGTVVHLGSFGISSAGLAFAALIVVLAFGYAIDAVDWSMHRFYKRRLWSAFTYDPSTRNERDWATTATKLSEQGIPIENRPELVMCAAAQVSGPELAPPGHRAVPWTFDAHWCGSAEVGYCKTTSMEGALADHHRLGDVSMFGGVAIAGAAFGSAMGRHSMGSLNAVFALSNARLGVWLPNPRQLRDGNWEWKHHNLSYLAREIFGRYSPYGRWMLVADGGHYENLGLIELLRRRCKRIVCIDASGDASGAVTTVAEALRLAEQEFGVVVTIAEPWTAAPGDAELPGATERLADALKGRLAASPVVVGHISYPPEAGVNFWSGTLIVGRAVLDPATPWPVTSYAVGNDAFPNDPTTDQWFDADQFDDYCLLGRHVADNIIGVLPSQGWYDA